MLALWARQELVRLRFSRRSPHPSSRVRPLMTSPYVEPCRHISCVDVANHTIESTYHTKQIHENNPRYNQVVLGPGPHGTLPLRHHGARNCARSRRHVYIVRIIVSGHVDASTSTGRPSQVHAVPHLSFTLDVLMVVGDHMEECGCQVGVEPGCYEHCI